MPVSADNFRDISNAAGRVASAGKTVHLSKSGDALVMRGSSRFGRIVSWFRGYRSAQHSEVRKSFLDALTSVYGKNVAGMTAAQVGLSSAENMKKALTSRDIYLAFQMADQHKSNIEENNDQMATRYSNTSDTSPNSVKSKVSEILSKGDSQDMQKVRELIDVNNLGDTIRKSIQRRGKNAKHWVTKTEAESIANSDISNAVAEEYKKMLVDKYTIPGDAVKKDNEGFQLLSKSYQRLGMTVDAEKLGTDTTEYINDQIYEAIANEVHRGTTYEPPAVPSKERIVGLIEERLDKFTEQRAQAKQAVDELDIGDKRVKEELSSFVSHTNMTIADVKNAWSAGIAASPHLKVIADADAVSEKELAQAVKGYMDAVFAIGDPTREEDHSIKSTKARSYVMMLAQGSWDTALKLHSQITKPGPFRDYRRAMNYYRIAFPASESCQKQEALYFPSLRKAHELAAWMEGLGMTLAERFEGPEAQERILDDEEFPQSPDMDDRTLTLMRNTGIKIPTPDRWNCEGEGTYCDEAVGYIEKKLAAGNLGKVKDDICEQFLLDMGVRSDIYFNGVQASANDVVDKLKDFCTNENGQLDRNMMFGLSQIHQATLAPQMDLCFNEQIGPVPGVPVGTDKTAYHFDKNDDGSVSVRASTAKNRVPIMSSIRSGDVLLDPTKSNFSIALDLHLDPNIFTAERDHYFPAKVVNATYQYSLYTKDD
ncbi:MAG: hypothetical protein GDA45_00130 [Chromatiales bacterium]|nr:hypothetical protein [Chromatiales bacterium]